MLINEIERFHWPAFLTRSGNTASSSTPAAGSALSSAEGSFKVTAKETPHCCIFYTPAASRLAYQGSVTKRHRKKNILQAIQTKKKTRKEGRTRRLPSCLVLCHQRSGSQSGPDGPPTLHILDLTHPFQDTEPLIMS